MSRRAPGAGHPRAPWCDLGARFVWRASNPLRMQGRGQPAALTVATEDAASDPFLVYDLGRGRLTQAGGALIGSDGYVPQNRSNFADYSLRMTSGWTRVGSGTASAGTPGARHFIDYGDHTPLVVTNPSAGTSTKVYRAETGSSTYKRVFALLVYSPGGDPRSLGLRLYTAAAAPAAGDYRAAGLGTACDAIRVREDGWYQLWTVHPISSATVYLVVECCDEAAFMVTGAAWESCWSGFEWPTWPIPLLTASRSRNKPSVDLHPDPVDRGTPQVNPQPIPPAGWLAAGVAMPWGSDDLPGLSSGGWAARWAVSATDFLGLYWSASSRAWVAWVSVADVSQAFLVGPTTWPRGARFGLAMAWGLREGAPQFAFSVNGEAALVDVSGSLPAGDAWIEVGGDSGASLAFCGVQLVAAGALPVSRSELRLLSRAVRDAVTSPWSPA